MPEQIGEFGGEPSALVAQQEIAKPAFDKDAQHLARACGGGNMQRGLVGLPVLIIGGKAFLDKRAHDRRVAALRRFQKFTAKSVHRPVVAKLRQQFVADIFAGLDMVRALRGHLLPVLASFLHRISRIGQPCALTALFDARAKLGDAERDPLGGGGLFFFQRRHRYVIRLNRVMLSLTVSIIAGIRLASRGSPSSASSG